MNDETAVTAALELAASSSECVRRWDDADMDVRGFCDALNCVHCRAGALLPELRCRCGAFGLDRVNPYVWDSRGETVINHAPEACEPPKKPTHCAYCRQSLPDSAITGKAS